MSRFNRALAAIAPGLALRRAMKRAAFDAITAPKMNYDAATTGRRGHGFNAARGDADAVAGYGRRARIAAIGRDLVRNNPYAASAQRVVASNVVGDGIIPAFRADLGDEVANKQLKTQALRMIERLVDTTAIDRAGQSNLYGLQRQIINTVVDAGEALVIAHFEPGGPDPLQIEVLEPDHLDSLRDGFAADGSFVQDGIAFDARGRRIGYWIYAEHPGAMGHRGGLSFQNSVFVPADRVAHIYRVDRPGQNRGVSWLAPVAMTLADIYDYQDAQQVKQKVSACLTGFRKMAETPGSDGARDFPAELEPGLIYDLPMTEEITFSNPPQVGDFEPVIKLGLRAVAAGMGITYEAMAMDLKGVNFTSGRMGRLEMDRNVSSWQWTMMIPQFCAPLGRWLQQSWVVGDPAAALGIMSGGFDWRPPRRMVVDPAREFAAMETEIRAGLNSLQGVQRSLGFDPERLQQEQREDRAIMDDGLFFSTDVRRVSNAGVSQRPPEAGDLSERETQDD